MNLLNIRKLNNRDNGLNFFAKRQCYLNFEEKKVMADQNMPQSLHANCEIFHRSDNCYYIQMCTKLCFMHGVWRTKITYKKIKEVSKCTKTLFDKHKHLFENQRLCRRTFNFVLCNCLLGSTCCWLGSYI